jgi:hypothetical protein
LLIADFKTCTSISFVNQQSEIINRQSPFPFDSVPRLPLTFLWL